MSGYTQALLSKDIAHERGEQAKDAKKLGMYSMLGGFLLPLVLGPGAVAASATQAATQTAAQTAGTILGSTAQAAPVAAATGGAAAAAAPNVTNIVAGLSKAGVANPTFASKLAAPFTKIAGVLGPEYAPAATKGLMKTVGSSLGAFVGGKLSGIADKEYTFAENTYDQYANPFSVMNISKGIDTMTSFMENQAAEQSKLDELKALRGML